MTSPGIPPLRVGDRVRVTTTSETRIGYVQSSTAAAVVLEPSAYGAPAPSFEWRQIRRIELRTRNPAGSIIGAALGAIALGTAGWVVAFLMTWGDTARQRDFTALCITAGVMAGGLLGAVCGMVVRHSEPMYDA